MEARCTSPDRKLILHVMERELGIRAQYHYAPSFAYEVGPAALLRDGRIVVEGDDTHVLEVLASLGLCNWEFVSTAIDSSIISFPMDSLAGRSLVNLVCMMAARQHLINRALDLGYRRGFHIALSFADALTNRPPRTVAEFLQVLYGHEGECRGISFDLERLSFPAFAAAHSDERDVCQQLADHMVAYALAHEHVKPRIGRTGNSKYTFRTWLNALGMTGPIYERARAVMLARLPGHADHRRPAPKGREVRHG